MPTIKKRVNITVDDEMWDMLIEHRNRAKLMSIAAAALDLIGIGLEAYEKDRAEHIARPASNFDTDPRLYTYEQAMRLRDKVKPPSGSEGGGAF